MNEATASEPLVNTAVLIAVANYGDQALNNIPAALNSLDHIQRTLSSRNLINVENLNVLTVKDPPDGRRAAVALHSAAQRTTGLLLVYYVGHGLLTNRAELCLAVGETSTTAPEFTSVPYRWIADILRESPARTKISVLDCCFSGRAIEALSSDEAVVDFCHVDGVYTLSATARNAAAHVAPIEQQATRCTSFTGELVELMRAGIPDAGEVLGFQDIFPHLRQRLLSKQLPAPSQRAMDSAGRYPLIKNAAHFRITEVTAAPLQTGGSVNVAGTPASAPIRSALLEIQRVSYGYFLALSLLPSVLLGLSVSPLRLWLSAEPSAEAPLPTFTVVALAVFVSLLGDLIVVKLIGAGPEVVLAEPGTGRRARLRVGDFDVIRLSLLPVSLLSGVMLVRGLEADAILPTSYPTQLVVLTAGVVLGLAMGVVVFIVGLNSACTSDRGGVWVVLKETDGDRIRQAGLYLHRIAPLTGALTCVALFAAEAVGVAAVASLSQKPDVTAEQAGVMACAALLLLNGALLTIYNVLARRLPLITISLAERD